MFVRCSIVVLLVTLLCNGVLHAQQLATFYSVDQGLPQSTVTSLYRDNAGFLWVGTGDGLGVFDGVQFQQIRKSSDSKAAIMNSVIRGIIPSQDQKTIWVGTEGGINQFDRFSLKLIRSFDLVRKPGVAQSPVYANDTAVWIVAASVGLCRVRIVDGKMTIVSKWAFEGCYTMLEDGRVAVYTDTSDALVSVNLLSGKTQRQPLPYGLTKYSVLGFRSIPENEKDVLVLTLQGLYVLNTETCVLKRYTLGCPGLVDSTMQFHGVTFHPDGSWWFAVVGQGVFRYDPIGKSMRPCFWQQNGAYFGNQMKSPTAILCDEYGVVWCGTEGFGLVKMLHGRVLFHEKYNAPLVTDTCNWFTRCFYEMSSKRYLVGTYQNGLRLIDEETKSITSIGVQQTWLNNTPLFITGGGAHDLLIGTEKGLILLDTLEWATTTVDLGLVGEAKFTGFLRLRGGRLLVYGSEGLYEYTTGQQPHFADKVIGKCIGGVTCALERADGTLVVALAHRGIAELSKDWSTHTLYDYEKSFGFPLDISVRGMFEDGIGRLWLGTDQGLVALGEWYKVRAEITIENGLPDNTVYATVPMENGIVAVSTGRGLALFNSTNDDLVSYSYADGLPSNECNSGALLFSTTGKLYVGTTQGFVKWSNDHAVSCYRSGTIMVSESTLGAENSVVIRESIIRDYGNAAIGLTIWQTDFAFPERVIFDYQLQGSGEERTRVTGLRNLNYSALASGFYSFMCASDVPGCPTPRISKLFTIRIIPPYWLSGWFIGIVAMAVVLFITLILFIVMRVRYQRKIRKLKMQQELDKVRQRISRDIHDEIGAGLTRIALSGDLMSQKFVATDPSFDKLKWIAGTARELSQNMKEVVWSVNPHYDSLDHMCAYLRSHASDVAEKADMRFKYSGNDSFPELHVNPETRRNLLLILKETLSNMVKHAGATELSLQISWEENRLIMVISDNGKGFDPNSPEKVNSNGLRNMQQRAQSIGCMISVTSQVEKGTQTDISGPITPPE